MGNRTGGWPVGPVIMAVSGFAALVVSLVNYFLPSSGISFTGGALLVVCSSAALLLAALVEMWDQIRYRWIGSLFTILIILGILGTAAAAYFLEATWLEVALAFVFLGWLVHLFWEPGREPAGEHASPAQMSGAHS